MTEATARLDKSGRTIQDMFAGVAPRYDLLNHLLSANLDVVWRKRAAQVLDPAPGTEVLDLCCGTGDQAVALRKRGAKVAAADFCIPMLALARPQVGRLAAPRARADAPGPPPSRTPTPPRARPNSRRLAAPRPGALAADALALPFPPSRFEGATVSFGPRHAPDLAPPPPPPPPARPRASKGPRSRAACATSPTSTPPCASSPECSAPAASWWCWSSRCRASRRCAPSTSSISATCSPRSGG